MTQLVADAVLDRRVKIVRVVRDELLGFVTLDDGTDVKVNWRAGGRGWRCSCARARCWHVQAVELTAAPGGERPALPARPDRRRHRA